MKFTREIQGGTTYLVYQIQPEEQIDTLSLGMIVNNKIEGIPPRFTIRWTIRNS